MAVLKGRLKKSQLIAAGIFEDYHAATLANYRGPRRNRDHVANYIKNLEFVRKKGLSILMFGENNSGKTTLSSILAKAFLLSGLTARVTTLRDMTDLYTATWRKPEEKQSFDKQVRECDLLVIDDLNKELHNKATAAVLDEVLRYRSNRHLPFVITTNATLDELEAQYGPSFCALLSRRAAVLEFKQSLKEADRLVDKNLAILNSLQTEEK